MSIENKKRLLETAKIVSIVFGVLFCFTLFGIIVGVFLFIASNRLRELEALTDAELDAALRSNKYFGWAIFELIVIVPFGLLMFLPYVITTK